MTFTAHCARELLPAGVTYVRLVWVNALARAYRVPRGHVAKCWRCGAEIPAGAWFTVLPSPLVVQPRCSRCVPFDALRSTLGA